MFMLWLSNCILAQTKLVNNGFLPSSSGVPCGFLVHGYADTKSMGKVNF